jgi:hypothetical protein
MYGAWKLGGYTGLMVWFSVLASLLVVAAYTLCSLYSQNCKVAFLGGVIFWLFSTEGLAPRTHLIGYLLLICELLIVKGEGNLLLLCKASVASFVGLSNLLEGTVARELAGADGTVLIRPERIRITPEAGGTHQGTVRETVYHGAVTHYRIGLDSGAALTAVGPGGQAARGERVAVAWDDDAVLRLDGAGPPPPTTTSAGEKCA